MNFRVKILLVFIPLSFLLCFMSNTYSRYVADTTGDLKMSFAQWQILVNNEDITNNSSSSIVLNPIIEENSYVKSNKIAPSSTGYFDINIERNDGILRRRLRYPALDEHCGKLTRRGQREYNYRLQCRLLRPVPALPNARACRAVTSHGLRLFCLSGRQGVN